MTKLIDADELREFLNWTSCKAPYSKKQVLMWIDMARAVDAVPVRHGKWIYGNDFHWYTASCNKCGYQRRTDIKADRWNQWNYCPNCGARMDEE